MAIRDVIVQLNGGTHTLRSDLGAWAAVEDAGEDYMALIKRLTEEGPKMRPILLLLWAYLDHETPRPALQEVKRWVTMGNFGEVTKAVVQAFHDGMPDEEELKAANPPGTDAWTGQPSVATPPA